MVETGVPGRPYGLHARDGRVWVACYGDQSVVRIDPRQGRVVGRPSGSASTRSPSTSAATVGVGHERGRRPPHADRLAKGRGARARRRAAPGAPGWPASGSGAGRRCRRGRRAARIVLLTASTLTESSSRDGRVRRGAWRRPHRGRAGRVRRARGAAPRSARRRPARPRRSASRPRVRPAPGAQKASDVPPTRTTSPSRRRRRAVTRSSLTHVPLRERPSSAIVQSLPSRSSVAWVRDTRASHASATSVASSRPIVSCARSPASSTMSCRSSSSRSTRNGAAGRLRAQALAQLDRRGDMWAQRRSGHEADGTPQSP